MTADVDALITRLRSVGRAFEGLRWLDDAATTLAAVVAERDEALAQAHEDRDLYVDLHADYQAAQRQKDAATRQLAEAREAIENAPHPSVCNSGACGICAWKSRALAALASTGGA